MVQIVHGTGCTWYKVAVYLHVPHSLPHLGVELPHSLPGPGLVVALPVRVAHVQLLLHQGGQVRGPGSIY